jgi:hypothetical protein
MYRCFWAYKVKWVIRTYWQLSCAVRALEVAYSSFSFDELAVDLGY